MTQRKLYLGSVGAYLWDDDDLIDDADDDWDGEYQRALTTDAEISVAGLIVATTIITADYTVLATDGSIYANASSAKITVTLPTAVGIAGRNYLIKKTDISTNKVVLEGYGSETINLETSQELSFEGDAAQVESDGTNWHFI